MTLAELVESMTLEVMTFESAECESKMNHICTREATYRVSSRCNPGASNWCTGRYDVHRVDIVDGVRCGYCLGNDLQCWTVRPI